jgi:hypothetical protein
VIPVPPRRYIPVHDWDEDATDAYTGLRHALLEATEGPCTAMREIQVKGTPTLVMEPEVGRMFEVHEESVAMLLEFELELLVARHRESARMAGEIGFGLVGEGYKFYVQFGAITLAKSQVGEVDSILRRSHWREQHGLSGYNYDRDRAYAMTVEAPVPREERKLPAKPDEAVIREARRRALSNEVRSRRISLADLHRDWADQVSWRELGHQGLPMRKLLEHCLQKGNERYSPGISRGWARHHFVRLGELTQFLKDNPHVAELVKVHRNAARRKSEPKQLLAA